MAAFSDIEGWSRMSFFYYNSIKFRRWYNFTYRYKHWHRYKEFFFSYFSHNTINSLRYNRLCRRHCLATKGCSFRDKILIISPWPLGWTKEDLTFSDREIKSICSSCILQKENYHVSPSSYIPTILIRSCSPSVVPSLHTLLLLHLSTI